jgi:hypothetical protein
VTSVGRTTTTPAGESAAGSLRRRLSFAGAWRYHSQVALLLLGIRSPRLSGLVTRLGSVVFDLMEFVRTGGQASHLGRAAEAALTASARVPQQPRYRNYWNDPRAHSLVGLVVGLDLHRHAGKYHVLEVHLPPALKPERRRLYESDIDPLVSTLASAARDAGYARLVLCKHYWTGSYWTEFERASRATGIGVTGAAWRAGHRGHMVALPDPLPARTLYADWGDQVSPLLQFLGNKLWSARWLGEMLDVEGARGTRLAWVPTSDRLILPKSPSDARWPNLVVKLANGRRGLHVAMGRFDTEDQARLRLRLPDNDPGAVPGVFEQSWKQRLVRRLLPTREVVYQPFVPPEVIDGRVHKIRVFVFVSPLFDAFLSAHHVSAGEDLPDGPLPPGSVVNGGPYASALPKTGARFRRVPPDVEDELRDVALEFGRIAGLAITRKFETGP